MLQPVPWVNTQSILGRRRTGPKPDILIKRPDIAMETTRFACTQPSNFTR